MLWPPGQDPTAEAEVDTAEGAETVSAGTDQASLLRALRDLEAAKARVERDAQRSAQEMRETLIKELLPVLDNIDRTIYAAAESGETRQMIEGVQLVRNQLAGVLARFGVERVEARHQPFDPSLHEAIGTVPVTHASAHNVVIEQIEPGYRYGTRLVRPAKVIVGKLVPRVH
jgi:molecular chaperone GrpE (heat shock protein)